MSWIVFLEPSRWSARQRLSVFTTSVDLNTHLLCKTRETNTEGPTNYSSSILSEEGGVGFPSWMGLLLPSPFLLGVGVGLPVAWNCPSPGRKDQMKEEEKQHHHTRREGHSARPRREEWRTPHHPK